MKHLAIFALASVFFLNASASDKDTLRDACSSIKLPAKKSACFDALDRFSALPPQAALAVAKPAQSVDRKLKLSSRGLQCGAIEFQELDSMPADDLEGLYCSYALGSEISQKTHKESVDKHADNPRIKIALIEKQLVELDRCGRGLARTGDIFRRKFSEMKIDCSKLPQSKAIDSASQEGAPSAQNP